MYMHNMDIRYILFFVVKVAKFDMKEERNQTSIKYVGSHTCDPLQK